MPCHHSSLLLILYLHTALHINLFHFPNNAYSLLFTAGTLGFFESVYTDLGKASPVLFVCFCSDWVCKEYGGCRRLYVSLHLLWVLAHSFHKYSLSNAGDRMLCLYNHCFLLRLKPPQHVSLQEALLRRSMFLSYRWHGLWATAQLGGFLEKDLTSVRANFRKT